ncbi:MAG: hypothetical protein Q9216_003582 [Gyalolechia sp. 2 TL-2023]
MTEEALAHGGRSAQKAMDEAGFSEELKRGLEAKIAASTFRNENPAAFAQLDMPSSAGRGTREQAAAQPWTGTEAVEDVALRMLNDAHKPLRGTGPPKIPQPRTTPIVVDMRMKGAVAKSQGERLANARDRTSVYALSQDSTLSDKEKEDMRRVLKDRFTAGARPMPATVQGLAALANERIEDAIGRGQFKNIARGKGKNIERDYTASSPFLDTTEYFMNKIIQKQDIVPPWIEKQQELVKEAQSFRSRLRNDWKRHAARVVASKGGSIESQIRRAEAHAAAEAAQNPKTTKIEALSEIDMEGRLSQVTVTESTPALSGATETTTTISENLASEAPKNASSTATEDAPAHLEGATDSLLQSPPSISDATPAPRPLPSLPPFRDPAWESLEHSYHTLAISSLNSLTRSYNLMAPDLAKKPYFSLERELRSCFADVAPLLPSEIKDRARRPERIRVDIVGHRPGGVLEKFGGGEKTHVNGGSLIRYNTTSANIAPLNLCNEHCQKKQKMSSTKLGDVERFTQYWQADVSLLASVVGLADGAFKLVSYMNTVKDGGKQRLHLFTELNALWMVLKLLEAHFESDDEELTEPWLKTIAVLDEDKGVFDQIETAFKDLDSRLRPRTGHRKVRQTLGWPLDKSEVESLTAHLERLKTSVQVAMTSTNAAVIREMQNDTKTIKSSLADNEVKAILDWISGLNFLKQPNDFMKQTREGTGRWFLEREEFRIWSSSKEALLWAPGIPGAGKTFLASIVVEYLKTIYKKENVAVLVIYCGYNEAKSQSIDNLIAALIKQVIQVYPNISKEIQKMYQQHSRTQIFPSLQDLVTIFRSELTRFDDCYIVVDGLDEISDESSRLLLLETLANGPVNIMVTSRRLESIQELFAPIIDVSCEGCEEDNLRFIYSCKQCLGRGPTLCDRCRGQELTCHQEGHRIVKRLVSHQVDIGATENDIRLYLEARINNEPRLLENVTKKRALREEIASTIVQQSNGMFLLAKLHVDALATKRTPRAVQEALQSLPTEIGDTYDQAMQRIEGTNDDDRQIAMNFLLWITTAARPLTVSEVEHACSIKSSIREIDPYEVLSASDLTSMCAGLVIIDASDIVRLVHFSAQNYFDVNREKWFPESDTILTEDCLSYLSFKAFDTGACSGPKERDDFATRSLDFPLLEYCCSYWGYHAACAKQPEVLTDRVLDFLSHEKLLESAVQALWYAEGPAVASWDVKSGVLGLHLAAYFGLTHVTARLLRAGADIDARDSLATTPLMYAAAGGHVSVVQQLIREGADPNLICGRGTSSLHRAIVSNDVGVARTLLNHPDIAVNLLDSSRNNQTPLMIAASLRRIQIIPVLIHKPGLDVNFQFDDSQSTALHLAAASGDSKTTRLILSHPEIDVNKKSRWSPPLTNAASGGYFLVVEALLDHGADPELQEGADEASGTALNRAIDYGHAEIVRLLLERGANPRVLDTYNRTIIHSAAVNGQTDILRILFEENVDVDINAQGTNGRTAMHDATYFNYCSTIKVLFENGARTDIHDAADRSPLGIAKDMDNLHAVELLTKLRKNEQTRDEAGGTLKHTNTSMESNDMGMLKAAKLGMTETIQFYVSRASSDLTIDLNVSDLDHHTALHLAVSNHRLGILQLLVDAGANLNAIDRLKRTPLHWSALYNNRKAAERLLEAGADCSLEDHFEDTALEISFHRVQWDLSALLLAYGAWPKPNWLQTSLYAAAMYGTAGIVKKLVDAGANPPKKDSMGQSPYHVAEEVGNDETAEIIPALCENRGESTQETES